MINDVEILLISLATVESTNSAAPTTQNDAYQQHIADGNELRCANVLMTINEQSTCDFLTQVYSTLKTCDGNKSTAQKKKLQESDVDKAVAQAPVGSAWENKNNVWTTYFESTDTNNEDWSALTEFMKVNKDRTDAQVLAEFPTIKQLQQSCYTWCGEQKVSKWSQEMCDTAQSAYDKLKDCDGKVTKTALTKFFVDNHNSLKHMAQLQTANYTAESYAEFLANKMSVDTSKDTIAQWEFIKPFSGWTNSDVANSGGEWDFKFVELINQVAKKAECGTEAPTDAPAPTPTSGVAQSITPAALIATMALFM